MFSLGFRFADFRGILFWAERPLPTLLIEPKTAPLTCKQGATNATYAYLRHSHIRQDLRIGSEGFPNLFQI